MMTMFVTTHHHNRRPCISKDGSAQAQEEVQTAQQTPPIQIPMETECPMDGRSRIGDGLETYTLEEIFGH